MGHSGAVLNEDLGPSGEKAFCNALAVNNFFGSSTCERVRALRAAPLARHHAQLQMRTSHNDELLMVDLHVDKWSMEFLIGCLTLCVSERNAPA